MKRRRSLVASAVVLIIVVILLRNLEIESTMLLKRIRGKKLLLSKSQTSPNEEIGIKRVQALRKSSVVLSSNLDLRMVVVSVSLTSRRVRSKLQNLKVKTPHRRNKARPSQMVSISQSEKKEIKLCQK